MAAGKLERLTKAMLYQLAQEHQISKRSKMSKAELVRALESAGVRAAPETEHEVQPLRPLSGSVPRPEPAPAPREPLAAPFVDWGHPLPLSYGLDRIVALARDPFWIFAYWELEGPRRKALAAESGQSDLAQAQWLLRVRNLTALSQKQVPISADSYNWYLRVDDGCEYEIDLGVLSRTGRFIVAVTSNRTSTPSSKLSPEETETWMVIEGGRRHVVTREAAGLPEWAASMRPSAGPAGLSPVSPGRSGRPPRGETP